MKIHIVQKDDTLQTIMDKYHITKQTIRQSNPHIANMEALLAGMKVKIASTSVAIETNSPSNKRREKASDDSLLLHRKALYAQVHRRPFGEMIAYDYQPNISRNHDEQFTRPEQDVIEGVCCHCHQAIYPTSPYSL